MVPETAGGPRALDGPGAAVGSLAWMEAVAGHLVGHISEAGEDHILVGEADAAILLGTTWDGGWTSVESARCRRNSSVQR